MVHRILFWTGFGLAVRFWQLGIEMRPLFQRNLLWAYPVFAGIGASFGFYLEGMHERQMDILTERKDRLLAKRRRRDEREQLKGVEGQVDGAVGGDIVKEAEKVMGGTTWGR